MDSHAFIKGTEVVPFYILSLGKGAPHHHPLPNSWE